MFGKAVGLDGGFSWEGALESIFPMFVKAKKEFRRQGWLRGF